MVTTAPLLGRAATRNGSCCGAPPGIDCADFSKSKHQQRRIEKRQWQRQEGLTGRPAGNDEEDDARGALRPAGARQS